MNDSMKKSRIDSSRSLTNKQSEDARIRKYLSNPYTCPLAVDEDSIPHDMEYRWVRDSVLGQPDFYRVAEMKRKGWNQVSQERHPERMMDETPWRKNPTDGVVSYKGNILMERPKEYGQIERKAKNEKNRQQMLSVPGQDHLMNEPSMPMRVFNNETSIQKMASFKDD